MNIAFVSRHEFNPQRGGIERVTDTLIKEFLINGHNVYSVVLIKENSSYLSPCNIYCFPETDVYSSVNREWYNNLLNEKEINVIINQYGLSRESYLFLDIDNHDIKKVTCIHSKALLSYDTYAHLVMCSTWEWKKIVKLAFLPLFKFKYLTCLKSHYRKVFKMSDKVVFLSSKYKKDIERLHLDIDIAKFESISNPLPTKQEELESNKENYVVYCSRMDNEQKNPISMIRIWNDISKRGLHNWTLIMIGDGPDLLEVKRTAERLGCRNVIFTGFTDPFPYYKKAKIYCATSKYEGFLMTLIEAMSFGCVPILFDSYVVASEIVDNGKNGFLIDAFDERKFASILAKLMVTSDISGLQKEAVEKVKIFSTDRIASKWFNLFNAI